MPSPENRAAEEAGPRGRPRKGEDGDRLAGDRVRHELAEKEGEEIDADDRRPPPVDRVVRTNGGLARAAEQKPVPGEVVG